VARELEVVGELGRIDSFRGRQPLERLGHAVVEADASAGRELAVEHLPHEGVREGERIDALGQLEHESRGHGLLERRHDLLGRGVDKLLHDPEAEGAPVHRGRREHLRREG
jgi:hypothetical protein